MSILLAVEKDTLKVHTSGGKKDTTSMSPSILLVVERDTTCKSILLALKMDTACMSVYCWQWKGYTMHVHRRLLTVLLLLSYAYVGLPDKI
jgi:hypothetical protein